MNSSPLLYLDIDVSEIINCNVKDIVNMYINKQERN